MQNRGFISVNKTEGENNSQNKGSETIKDKPNGKHKSEIKT